MKYSLIKHTFIKYTCQMAMFMKTVISTYVSW